MRFCLEIGHPARLDRTRHRQSVTRKSGRTLWTSPLYTKFWKNSFFCCCEKVKNLSFVNVLLMASGPYFSFECNQPNIANLWLILFSAAIKNSNINIVVEMSQFHYPSCLDRKVTWIYQLNKQPRKRWRKVTTLNDLLFDVADVPVMDLRIQTQCYGERWLSLLLDDLFCAFKYLPSRRR